MKIGRFKFNDESVYGIIKGSKVDIIKDLNLRSSGEKIKLENLKILAPTEPSKIICIGLNYVDHARELKMEILQEPIIFLKPPTAVIGHEENIVYPPAVKQVDYEAELGIVIGKKCKNVTRERAYNVILGYTCFNDVTARDLQKKDGQWTRAKSFDTFAPLGPYIVTKDEIKNLHNLNIKLRLNGKIKQDSNTKNFIFDIPFLVEFISGIMTLNQGDVIPTGTPPGVGSVKRGDTIEIEIERIGVLRNFVV
ncbi:MAG: fumarylacetoacetate hydrolase family protein [Candidatus Hydrothermarchaeota archaeon]|nr:fumarylacetoacetate hydrolase family protein [Candidatus Hydrothermarchaeota archaeon]